MKLKTLIASAVCMFAASAALPSYAADKAAQKAPRMEKMTEAQWEAKMAEWDKVRTERRAALEKKLNLNKEQKAAWDEFVKVTDANRPDFKKGAMPKPDSMTAPQRMEKRIEFMKKHLATMEANKKAMDKMYNTLNADQKKIFDAEGCPGFPHAGKGMGRGPGKGMGRGHGRRMGAKAQ